MDIMFETRHLVVRKFRIEDAEQLYENHMDEEAGELADKIRSTGAATCVEGHWQPVKTEDTLADLLN